MTARVTARRRRLSGCAGRSRTTRRQAGGLNGGSPHARSRRQGSSVASFHRGDALALPFQDDSVDAAAMALVIFFLPDPAKGVAEMFRVVRPGGLVAAYAWDVAGGGLPGRPMSQEIIA